MTAINFSISDTISLAWIKFKENITTWIGASILVLILGGIAGDKSGGSFYGLMDITYPSTTGVIFGFLVPGIDNAAHIGGLIIGSILGLVLIIFKELNLK